MFRKATKRFGGMFAKALVPIDDSQDNDDDDESNEDGTTSFDQGSSHHINTLRSLRWVIMVFLFLMSFMSLHIYTEDLKYFQDHGLTNRTIPLVFVMSSILLVALAFHGVYNVRLYHTFIFAILFTLLMVFKMNTQYWQQNGLNSIMLHLTHFVTLFCTWAFCCLGACHYFF